LILKYLKLYYSNNYTSMSLFKPEQILANPSKLSFSQVKQNKYGGNIVYLRFNGEPLYLQTGFMHHPYGVSTDDVKDKDGNVTGRKYSINHSFGRPKEGTEPDSKQVRNDTLHKVFELLDKLTVEQALKNCSEWLKLDPEDVDLKSVKLLYNPMIKKSKDKETRKPDGRSPDTFKSKILYYENDPNPFKTNVFDKEKNKLDILDTLKKGSTGRSIIEIASVSFYAGKFSISIKLRQVQAEMAIKGIDESYAFVDDSDDEDALPSKEPQFVDSSCDEEDVPVPNDKKQHDELDDELDEEESEEESEEEEAPPPPAVKKRVVKRK